MNLQFYTAIFAVTSELIFLQFSVYNKTFPLFLDLHVHQQHWLLGYLYLHAI
jgi:hypothetical protein